MDKTVRAADLMICSPFYLAGIFQFCAGFAAEVTIDITQALADELFTVWKFMGGEFQGHGAVIAGCSQMVQKAG